ncbi:FAD-binding monooxygenase moxY, partial [Fusarium oxysporum f. sp. albedinis]
MVWSDLVLVWSRLVQLKYYVTPCTLERRWGAWGSLSRRLCVRGPEDITTTALSTGNCVRAQKVAPMRKSLSTERIGTIFLPSGVVRNTGPLYLSNSIMITQGESW